MLGGVLPAVVVVQAASLLGAGASRFKVHRATNTTLQASSQWTQHSNKAISGFSLDKIDYKWLSECESACDKITECIGFVDTPNLKMCTLKSKVAMKDTSGKDVYIRGSSPSPEPSPSPTPFPVPSPSPLPAITLDVRVLVLVNENGQGDSSAPWYDPNASTMPLYSKGDVTQAGSTATNLSASDVAEIFEAVNEFYAPVGVKWNVVGPFFVRPTVPCNGVDRVCGRTKCRSSGYFTKYWGTISKRITKVGREERATNLLSIVPREYLKSGSFHMLYTKFLGLGSQGVVIGSDNWDAPWVRPTDDQGRVSVATCGQWSDKFTMYPQRRPNMVPCDGRENCGRGLAYTTAHELGHLFGLRHTDSPSIMRRGGASLRDSQFSPAQQQTIRSHAQQGSAAVSIPSFSEALVGILKKPRVWRSNTMCTP